MIDETYNSPMIDEEFIYEHDPYYEMSLADLQDGETDFTASTTNAVNSLTKNMTETSLIMKELDAATIKINEYRPEIDAGLSTAFTVVSALNLNVSRTE